MADTLIRNADWIVTVDNERRIIRDGAIAIVGKRIVAIGKTETVLREHTAAKEIDATGKLVMPGLIDTHVHNTQQLGRGLADECDLPVHLLERLYGYESALIAEDARRPDVERIGALGALGPNMCLIHMGWASPKEIVLCMKHDLKVSCTPSTGYCLGMGSMEFGRFPEMIELGVTVALGSDAAMSSNYLDIVREMFLAGGACKAQRLDPTIMPPETVIEMGTINGAKAALWEDEVGSLEVGQRADIAIFETRRVEWRPILNPLANLVYSSRGGAESVLCDGQILMEEGRVLTLNEKEILEEGQRRAERVAE